MMLEASVTMLNLASFSSSSVFPVLMACCIAAHMLSKALVGLNISVGCDIIYVCTIHYMLHTWKVDTVMGSKMLGHFSVWTKLRWVSKYTNTIKIK